MASPSRGTSMRHGTSSISVEDSPVMGLTSRPLPSGSIFISRPEVETHKVVTPKRRLSLACNVVSNSGDDSKSVEILEPKNEIACTPTRRITRSIYILSDSKERETQADKEAVKRTAQMNISGKRLFGSLEGDSSSKKKKILQHPDPQRPISPSMAYDFIIPPEDRFGGTINVFFKSEVISNLNAKLTETQKELFQSTCFGHFLQLYDIRLQNQVIHKLLLLEVKQPSLDEMWFVVDGNLIKFSIHEFCLASGLKCDGDDNTNMFKMGGKCRIRDTYFREMRSVFRRDVKHKFKNLPADTPDEDAVKIGILYLISTFLFTSTQRKVITDAMMRLVDSPYMNSFPWGKELFQITFKYLKNALSEAQPSGGDVKGILTYRLHGFPLAFQTWVYESIPSLSRKFCSRVRYGSPRIINWTNDDKRVSAASLEKFMFELDEVDVLQIKPTEQEKSAAYYIGLWREGPSSPMQCKISEKHNLNSNPNQSKQGQDVIVPHSGFIPSSGKTTPDATFPRDANIIDMIEKLKFDIAQIWDTQARIIDSQSQIIVDINRIEIDINSKFQRVLEVLTKKKVASQENGFDCTSPVPSKTPVSLNNKVIASLEKSVLKKGDASGSRSEIFTEAAQNLSAIIEKNVSTEESGKKSHEPFFEPISPDEIQYTEEDLIQVDQIVKSAQSMKGKCVDQGVGISFHSPAFQGKVNFEDQVVVQALFAQAPGHKQNEESPHRSRDVISFRQGNILDMKPQSPVSDKKISSNTAMDVNSPGQEIYTRYDMYPFSVDMSEPDEEDIAEFESWFSDGYKPGLIKFKFPPMKDHIRPPFQFGPYVIASKTWWYELRQCNIYLRDSHLNVCFYYLRKMLRFSRLKSFKCTTTDSFFGSMVRSAYQSCREDIHAISNFKSLVEIASGDYIHCNTNWSEVDHILMPIMMEKKAHWILAHFDIKDRALYVYNPSRMTVRDRVVIADMEAFACVIPCLMVKVDAWKTSAMGPSERLDHLDVKIETDIPQDEYGHDCGLFVIKYAEFIMRQETSLMLAKFNPNNSRLHLASQLFKHGCEKIIEGYETDNDNVPRSVRKQRKLSASKNM